MGPFSSSSSSFLCLFIRLFNSNVIDTSVKVEETTSKRNRVFSHPYFCFGSKRKRKRERNFAQKKKKRLFREKGKKKKNVYINKNNMITIYIYILHYCARVVIVF
jgi:hypothetical protein